MVRDMRNFLLALLGSALLTSAALAQGGPGPGPGPVPSPWTQSGSFIYYGGGVLSSPTVPGGSKGPATYNIAGGYYVNGVLVSGLPSIASGSVICNKTGASSVPTACTWNEFAKVGVGTTANSMPFYSGSAWGLITTGRSVLNPGTGALEYVFPMQTVTGASKTYLASDLYLETRRSNSGSAMSDTMPGSATTGLVSGSRVTISNVDATASIALSPGVGVSITGPTSIGPGRSISYNYDGPNTTWRPTFNTGTALLAGNNLTDVGNIATARANLIPSGTILNAQLVNSATTVNGQSCVLGSTCTIASSATSVTVGSTSVASGTAGRILYDATGTLGEYSISGSGTTVAMAAGSTLTTTTLTSPTINTPTVTTPAITGGGSLSGTFTGPFTASGATLTSPTINTPAITTPAITAGGSLAGTFTGTPTFSGANFLTLSNIAQSGAGTFMGNPTATGPANSQYFTVQGLTNLAAPSSTLDLIPIYDHLTGAIKNVTPGAIASSSTAGVSSLNSLTGALSIAAGSGIAVTPSTPNVSVALAQNPAFFATLGGTPQTGVVSSTPTLITFNTVTSPGYNTGGFFNTSTNRWTPPAGTVVMNGCMYGTGTIAAGTSSIFYIYKNGSPFVQINGLAQTGQGFACGSAQDRANGTDFYQVYGYLTTTAGTATFSGSATLVNFQGHWASP